MRPRIAALLAGSVSSAEPDGSGAGRDQRREHPDEGRLARAVRAEQPEDVASLRGERHLPDGAAPAETARQLRQFDAVEVCRHAATPESPPSSAP